MAQDKTKSLHLQNVYSRALLHPAPALFFQFLNGFTGDSTCLVHKKRSPFLMESPAAAVIQCQHEYTFAEASLQELMLRGHMHIHVLCRSSNHNRFLTSVEGPGLRLETHGLDFLLKEAPCILPREAQPNTACCSHLQSCGHGKGRYRVWVLVPCALSSQSRH